MKTRKKNLRRMKTKTLKAQKKRSRTQKIKLRKNRVLKDSALPLDLQAGGANSEKLNDDDCLLFMKMFETNKLRSYEDGKIRYTNSSIAKILQDEFPVSLIRKSLGKLNREGLLQIQLKRVPNEGIEWREITMNGSGLENTYLKDWLLRNSKIKENPFVNGNLSTDLQIDIDNAEPLNEKDFIIFFIIDRIGNREKGDTIGLTNSSISEYCKSRYSKKEIYHSLGKLVREGLIQVNIYETPQSTVFREIKVIPGFGAHPDLANWIANIKKNGFNNKQSKKANPDKPKTNEDIPILPLPMDVSWALRSLDVNLSGCDDNFMDASKVASMHKFQYEIFGKGVKNNLPQLKLTQKNWDIIRKESAKMATGETGAKYFLFTDFRFRIHLEALRLLSGKSLMDILYQGEVSVQNEFDETDQELYLNVCDNIWSLVEKKPDLDFSELTLKDLQNNNLNLKK